MLIICPQCRKKYSVKSSRCPYCNEYRPMQYDKIAEKIRKEEQKSQSRRTFTSNNYSSSSGNDATALYFLLGTIALLVCLFTFTGPSKSYLEATQRQNEYDYELVPNVAYKPPAQDSRQIEKPKLQIRNRSRSNTNKPSKTKTSLSNPTINTTKKDANSYVIEGEKEESLGEVIDKILTARKQHKSSPKNDNNLNFAAGLSNGAAYHKSTSDDKKAKYTPSSGYSSGGSVYVHGYFRRNGTYVTSHTRSRPGSGRRRR